MSTNAMFDYQKVAREAGLPIETVRELERCIRDQYGSDEMMIELRLLRTVTAIRDGAVSAREAIQEFTWDQSRGEFDDWLDAADVAEVQREQIRRLVTSELSAAERLLLVLYYYEKTPLAEIGARLSLPEDRVRVMHEQILERLRTALGAPLAARVFRRAS